MKKVKTVAWRSMSPDLWGVLKIKPGQHNPSSKEQLKNIVSEEWQNISPETLVSSIKNKDGHVLKKIMMWIFVMKGALTTCVYFMLKMTTLIKRNTGDKTANLLRVWLLNLYDKGDYILLWRLPCKHRSGCRAVGSDHTQSLECIAGWHKTHMHKSRRSKKI